MEREKYIPIGSVVLLEGGEKELMITGFCSISEDEPEKVYDYTGCIYPEGQINNEEIQLFDHDQIKKIVFVGYESKESKEYNEELKEIVKEYDANKNNSVETSEDVLNIGTTEKVEPTIIEESVSKYETLG